MAENELTGIERQLVLQYLMDGNVPVTVKPLEESSSDEKKSVKADASRIFPVALHAEQMTVLDKGIILLKNPPESVKPFDGKTVRVQFYFNKLGLYFDTTMKKVSSGLALAIPAVINHVTEVEKPKLSGLSAVLYYETGKKAGGVHIDCDFDDGYPIFTEPKWSSVPEEDAAVAKKYLEKAVMDSRRDKLSIGNGLFLIPVCRYLASEIENSGSIQSRKKNPLVLFVNHERIVFAFREGDADFCKGSEYALKMGFPLEGPVKERTVYLTCLVEAVLESDDKTKKSAVCRFTSIKEEDVRFLYEKSGNTLGE